MLSHVSVLLVEDNVDDAVLLERELARGEFALVVERVFAVPGLGMLAFESIRARDFPVLQAIFLLASLATRCATFGLELVYRRVSPQHVR